MSTEEMLTLIKDANVDSLRYGKGKVESIYYEEGKGYYLVVQFETEPKTFLARIAITNKVISLHIDHDEEEIINLLCGDVKKEDKSAVANTAYTSSNTELSKINILVEKLLRGKPIAYDLISLYDDADFENCLNEKAFSILIKLINNEAGVLIEQKACIIVALTYIAQKYYDGDLHSYIERRFREVYPNRDTIYTRTVIQNGVYKAVKPFRAKVNYFDEHSYVAVPLVYGCIPHYRVKDLFSIAYDVYKRNLLFDEDISDDQIIDKVSDILDLLRRKNLVSDSETIKGTSYLMSKYTQSCIFTGCGIEDLCKIISHCIRLIINHLSRPEDSFIVEGFFREGYDFWVKEFEGDGKERQKYETNKTISRPYFCFRNDGVHIITGEFSMSDALNPNQVMIVVRSEGVAIREMALTDPNDIVIDEDDDVFSGYIISRKDILLPSSPLDHISYSIVCDGFEIYNSREKLNRSILFFDGKGNEIKPGTQYDGELFVVSKTDNSEEYGDKIQMVYHGEKFFISTVEVNSSEVFIFDKEPYIFYKIIGSKILGYQIPWAEYISSENKVYPVYSDMSILFQASCGKEDIYIEVDGEECHYAERDDISYRIRLFSNEFDGNWIYLMTISALPSGYHRIRIINSITNKQVKGADFNILFDGSFWKAYLEKNESAINYNITNSFCENQSVEYKYGMPKYDIAAFAKNLGYGVIRVYPSAFSYSINGEQWFDVDKALNLFDIPESVNEIKICGPAGMRAYVSDNSALVKKQYLSVTHTDELCMYDLHIGYLRTITDARTARIVLEYGNRSKFVDVKYFPTVYKSSCEFKYDKEEKIHTFAIEFEGESQVKVVISPLNTDDIIAEKEISSGEIIYLKQDQIPKGVKFVSVSLHGKKYNSFFDAYQKDSFYRFPKYFVANEDVRITSWPPYIQVDSTGNNIEACIEFDGAERIILEVFPSIPSARIPLKSLSVTSGENIIIPIDDCLYGSYKVCLFSDTKPEEVYEDVPFYTTKTLYAADSILRKTYEVSELYFEGESSSKVDYGIYFAKIMEIGGRYYCVCKMFNNNRGIELNDILIGIDRVTDTGFEVTLRKLRDDKLTRMKMKDGRVIKGARLKKQGV